jgi:hypothetical protein
LHPHVRERAVAQVVARNRVNLSNAVDVVRVAPLQPSQLGAKDLVVTFGLQ